MDNVTLIRTEVVNSSPPKNIGLGLIETIAYVNGKQSEATPKAVYTILCKAFWVNTI